MAVKYASLPASWSNKKKVERLQPAAYQSLQRMLNRAVADTGVNFSIWSALRTRAEQIALFKANYVPAGRGRQLSTDRAYAGQIWKRKPGGVSVASPDLGSNHEDGLAIDIHPAPIQEWIKKHGIRYGFSWDEGKRVGESWHFRYIASRDAARSEGVLDHAAVQRAVGATPVDGKIGTGTVAKIKAWQKKNGLTADGKVGPATKAVMLGKGVADVVESVTEVVPPVAVVADGTYKLDTALSPNSNKGRVGDKITSITVHWWGKPSGQARSGIIAWLRNPASGVSAHYVATKGHVTRVVDEADTSWANGNRTANRESITIECDPNDVDGTIPTLAALIRDIRGRHGNLPIFPHSHWTATECPGAYRDRLGEIDALARGGFITPDTPTVKPAPAPAPKPTPAPVPAPKPAALKVDGRFGSNTVKAAQRFLNARGAKLTVDGKAGNSFWTALQNYLGTFPDGKVDNQSFKAESLGNGITQGWGYTGPGSKGSNMVRALQKWCGVTADGVWGESTTAAFQRKLIVHGYLT